MRSHAKQNADMRITVIVTPEEHAKIKAKAGLIPLSAWLRHLAIGEEDHEDRIHLRQPGSRTNGRAGVRESSDEPLRDTGELPVASRRSVSTGGACEHGSAYGLCKFGCKRKRGLAQVGDA